MKAIANQKGNEDLNVWIHSLVNHLYWSATSTEQGDGDTIVAKWKSLANHLQNVHTHDDPLFPVCLHGPNQNKQWLKPGQSISTHYLISCLI